MVAIGYGIPVGGVAVGVFLVDDDLVVEILGFGCVVPLYVE